MPNRFEQLLAVFWNWLVARPTKTVSSDLAFGRRIQDGQLTKVEWSIREHERAEHVCVLGKTGTGKSSLLKQFVLQDIAADRGFVFFDLHGDAQRFILSAIAEKERARNVDLSEKLIVIEPADPYRCVGINILERASGQRNFVQISEFAQILKSRWHLDSLGARTEELLRNALYVLSHSGWTLLEIIPLLTEQAFRSGLVAQCDNPEVRGYFENRYDALTHSMQATFREAVLNKVSAFTADPHFRHIVGQRQSSFSVTEAIDNAHWVIVNLDKGRLGEHAFLLGSLLLSKLKNAVFARRHQNLFTLYCDEIQNLVASDSSLDTLLSEARKKRISVVSANQFLEQFPARMRAAVLAVGTHVLFQLSTDDAAKMSIALAGGKQLDELLRHLAHREFVIKSGHRRWGQGRVLSLPKPDGNSTDLYQRCRNRWARGRAEIEGDIHNRQSVIAQRKEALGDWN